MTLSDTLRDEVFVNLGIRVVDGAKATDTWSLGNPAELRRELEARQEEKRAKELAKLENKRSIVEKEVNKWSSRHKEMKCARDVLFSDFSDFDDEGLPLSADLSASKRKAMKKDVEKFIKERAEFEAKGGQEYLARLEAELAEIVAQIN